MDKPWFKFTAADWLSGSIQLLSDAEKGTYIDLIAMIWKNGGVIQNDKILFRKLRIDYSTACDRINSYCELGILECDGIDLSIKFLDNQLEELNEKSKKNSDNAKKRWSKSTEPMRPHANKKRKEENREDKKRIDKSIEEDKETFDIFRKAYLGNRKGIDTEFDNFKKKHKDWKQVLPELKDLLTCQINQRETLRKSGQFVPEWKHLSTWINNRCWEEEYQKPVKKPHNPF